MQRYLYFYIGRVIISSQSGNIYPYLLLDSTRISSYCMFIEWLVEAHYLRMFLKISRIPHFTTLQKFADRITGTVLQRMITYFIVLLINVNHIFFGIDSSGFKSTHSSQYYTERVKLRNKKWIKLSVGADVLKQIICSIKIRRAPHARHDNVDFKPIITRASEIKPLSVVVADRGYIPLSVVVADRGL